MALREIQRVWTRQPQQVVRLRSDLGDESWAYTPVHGFTFAADNILPTFVNGGGFSTQPVASGLALSNVHNYGAVMLPMVQRRPKFGCAYVMQLLFTGTAAWYPFGCGNNNGGEVESLHINANASGSTSAGRFRFTLRDDAGRRTDVGPTNVVLQTNTLHTLVIYVDSGSTGGVRAWVDGDAVAMSWANSAFTDSSNGLQANKCMVGNFNYGPAGYTGNGIFGSADAQYSLVARLGRQPADGAALSLNPWSLFEDQRIYVPRSEGGAPSAPTLLAASAINITSTSFRPRVTFTR